MTFDESIGMNNNAYVTALNPNGAIHFVASNFAMRCVNAEAAERGFTIERDAAPVNGLGLPAYIARPKEPTDVELQEQFEEHLWNARFE